MFSCWNCTEQLESSGKANTAAASWISAVIKCTTTIMVIHVQFELRLKQVSWKAAGITRNNVCITGGEDREPAQREPSKGRSRELWVSAGRFSMQEKDS